MPVVTGAAGIAAGIIVGRTAMQRHRTVLGIPMPSKVDLAGISHQIGEAGKQFGRLASEVRVAGEKAEQIGKILS